MSTSTAVERAAQPQAPEPVSKLAKKARIEYGAPPRADLLPASERTRRETRALSRRWVRITLLSIVLAALIVAGAFVLQLRADDRLAAQQQRTSELLNELAGYQDIATAVSAERKLQDARATAMATDIVWTDLFVVLRSVLPGGAAIEAFQFSPGAAPGSGDGVGLATVAEIESPDPLDLAAIMDRLYALGPVTDVSMRLLEGPNEDDEYRYTVTVDFDQSVYSGQFADGSAE